MTEVEGWHFCGPTLRDGRPVPADGVWLEHTGPLVVYLSGLHLSERIIDALAYAPGATLCRVTGSGTMLDDGDKMVCSRRRIDWRIDAESILRAFARRCALDVVHLWDAPPVVRQYLETGDESIRSMAWTAADDTAAKGMAGDAARSAAAWCAARDAIWSATRHAAWYAAQDAARATAWSAARATAWSATGDAVNAAWSATRSAAWSAAWSAAKDAQDRLLTETVLATR